MKYSLCFILILMAMSGKLFCQTGDAKTFLDQGVKLYDQGDYKGAVEQYKKALEIDPKSPVVNYEIASTYYALNDFKTAIQYSDVVIDLNISYADQAYILKGSALDGMEKPKEAIKVYKKGIKEFPENNLLRYNLGFTYFNNKEYKEAEESLSEAIKLKPSHASSHLLMSYVAIEENQRVKSLLSLYCFLLLEPKGDRAKTALGMLEKQMKSGVTRANDKSTTITLSADGGDDDLRAADLMVSMLEAAKTVESNKGKTSCELFAENSNSFFSVLGELKKDKTGFWWNFYVDFFYAMVRAKQTEAFSYYISQGKADDCVHTWLKTNQSKIDDFAKWYATYGNEKK
jgi:hypothetical protein